MNEKVAIYGFFRDGICLYIGQTIIPNRRYARHQSKKRKQLLNTTFVILNWVEREVANAIELETINKYKAIGQARLNKGGVSVHSTLFYSSMRVKIEGFDSPFASLAAAGRALNCDPKAIHSAVKHNKPIESSKLGFRRVEILH